MTQTKTKTGDEMDFLTLDIQLGFWIGVMFMALVSWGFDLYERLTKGDQKCLIL